MDAMKKAAFQLDLNGLKALKPSKDRMAGLLLDACSAHDPDGKAQEKMRLGLKKGG